MLLRFLAVVLVVSACRSTEFRGATNGSIGKELPRQKPTDLSQDPAANPKQVPGPVPGKGIDPSTGVVPNGGKSPIITNEVFASECSTSASYNVDYKRSVGDRVEAVVKGKICPESREKLHLMFLVDYSGSMGRHYDDEKKSVSEGNDPLTAGSCGRLMAADAFVGKMLKEKLAGQEIVVSMIPFASQVITRKQVNAVSLESFAAKYVNAEHFCRYVAQEGYERPGESLSSRELGLLSSVEASTNYQAVLAEAQKSLAANSSRYDSTQVFFITDGEPTVPTSREQALSLAKAAGQSLREDRSIKNLSFNGLYLGKPGTDVYKRAAGVLAEIAGSAERVAAATDAKTLADKILNFKKPQINLDEKQYPQMASLLVAPYAEKKIGIRSLRQVNEGVWEYETQPFFLHGIIGQTIANVVKVDINAADGFLFKSTVNINYTQTE